MSETYVKKDANVEESVSSKPGKLVIDASNVKFGFQPNQILFIDDCKVGTRANDSPSKTLDIKGELK